MSSPGQKAVVITGASQGIGAESVAAYRALGHGVVATSRTIGPSQDTDLVTVRGDICEPDTAERVITSLVDHADSHVPSVLASLTKGGLQSAAKSLAIEYARHGIRVNAVSPGTIKTSMNPEETRGTLSGLVPVGRMGEPSDIVDAVLYLDNTPFVTGEILHVDGGQSAGR